MKCLKLVLSLELAMLMLVASAYALPEGETVIEGSAQFDRSEPGILKISTASDRLIVDYANFNIAQGESVYFFQPSSSSVALNRVVGSEVSGIYGALTANGIIYLINPNGIYIGPTAQINTAGFVASTLNIANQDFLNGQLVFHKGPGKNAFILSHGSIIVRNGGYVALLAGAVENQGTIQATLGTVVLASGEKVTLALDDIGEISVAVDEAVKEEVFNFAGEKVESAVKNSGTILAAGGKVILTAKSLNSVFDHAINNAGVIEARSMVSHNGVIELAAEGADVINKGRIAADGSGELPDAGRVAVEAGTINQQGSISANAFEGGHAGEVMIVSHSLTVLGEGSTTEARALGIVGTGGRVYVNSRAGNTMVDKNAVIDVSAGSSRGNAGVIEVSAFKQLGFYGILNGRAPPGYAQGTALLDPTDATISGTIAANTVVWATNNIVINGNITVNSGITLSLFADHKSATAGDWDDGVGSITVSGSFVIKGGSSGTRSLVLKAGSGIGTAGTPILLDRITDLSLELNPNAGSGGIYIDRSGSRTMTVSSATTRDGDISIIAANSLTVTSATAGGSGSLTLTVTGGGTNVLTTGTLTAIDNTITLTADSIAITGTVNAGSGDIVLQPQATNRAINLRNGSAGFNLVAAEFAFLNSSGTVTIGRSNGTGTVTIGASGLDLSSEDFNLVIRSSSSPVEVLGALTLKSGKSLTIEAGNDSYTQNAAVNVGSGTVSITADTIAISASLTANGGITLQPFTAGRAINLNSGNSNFSLTATELSNLSSTGTVTIGRSNGTGTVTIGASGAINLSAEDFNLVIRSSSASVEVLGALTLKSGKSLTITGSSIDINAALNVSGNVTFNGDTTFQNGGSLTLGAGALLTVEDSLSIAGATAALNASLGSIDLNGNFNLSSGAFIAPSGNFNISGNFNRTGGAFTHSSGTVIFDGTGVSQIFGSNTFYNFTSETTAGKELRFEAGTTQTITGTLTLEGSVGNLLVLRSSAGGTQWKVDPQGARSVSYADVQDSENLSGTGIVASHSTDSGNNIGWDFVIAEAGGGAAAGAVVSSGIDIQIIASSIPPELLPTAGGVQLSYEVTPFIPGGPVYYYHPLTPVDMAAFNEFILGEGEYEFLDGSINILGHEGLISSLDEIRRRFPR